MTWPSKFTTVPTSELVQDGPLNPSEKATRDQMRSYMRNVPAVYEKLRNGAAESDFQAMRASADPQQREVGDAYYHLFSPNGYDHRIEAEYIEGQGLVVQRGGHRVEAARELGIDHLPVYVRAPDQRTLDAVTERAERQVAAKPQRDGDQRTAQRARSDRSRER